MADKPSHIQRMVAQNRRARFDYEIQDTVEAGLALTGSEVKSLRNGRANIEQAYASVEDGEAWLINAYIPEYEQASAFSHEPRRPRKLLLHKREINRLGGRAAEQRMTLVPMQLYFNRSGLAKLQLGLAKGKRKVDKRETEKQRDWQRDKARLLREMN
jgi:SsrA-binding protein